MLKDRRGRSNSEEEDEFIGVEVQNLIRGFKKTMQEQIEISSKGLESFENNFNLEEELLQCSMDLKCALERENLLKNEIELLKKSLEEEKKERRRIHDELMTIKGNIRVFVRTRPSSIQQKNSKDLLPNKEYQQILEFLDSNTILFQKDKKFEFDACIDQYMKHDIIFETQVAPFVVSVLDGRNSTLIAYGQTGSGKTFTMEGSDDDPGMYFRAIERAFEIAKNRKVLSTFTVSILQVYNETIQDLLQKTNNNLEIHQNSETGKIFVKDLLKVPVSTAQEVAELLAISSKRRNVSGHAINEVSSRSHLVLTLEVNSSSSLILIDLAGSERVSKTGASGESLKESQHINRSLSALGDVLQALGEKQKHIPFRNSKLTFLLQDCFLGNGKVAFFACVSPEKEHATETLCTLNFAERIRKIEIQNHRLPRGITFRSPQTPSTPSSEYSPLNTSRG